MSTEEQAEHGYSIDEQRRLIRVAAADQGWELAAIFRDAGWSGAREPALQQLLRRPDEVDVVVIWAMDRLTRDLLLFAKLVQVFNAAEVRIEALTSQVDLRTPEGEAMAGVAAVFGQFERKRIAQRVKAAAAARPPGRHHGRHPYGYGPGMQIRDNEAAVIRRIFHEYAVEGRSQREITRRLNRDGIGAQRGEWTPGSISKLLRSPVYAGKLHFHSETLDARHEPIIDVALWSKAEALRDAGTRTKRGRSPNGEPRAQRRHAPLRTVRGCDVGADAPWPCSGKLVGGVRVLHAPQSRP